jgi:murein DD-endopeptidase MepM/ murein hydrolase activator NlpD
MPRADNLRLPLTPGGRAIIFCWFEIPSNEQPLQMLRHRLTYRAGSTTSQTIDLTSTVFKPTTLSLGAPAEAGEWFAASGPSNRSEHRTAQIRIDGNPDAPFSQRYAIDWVRICDGKLWQNKGKENTDYCGYGRNAIAVADSTIAAVRDDIPENKPGEGSRSIPITKDTMVGNYVVLDLGEQRFALYAHLQPNSVQVKPGATVKRGQILGRIGNSGNSDAPHLHFHVAEAGLLTDVVTGQTNPIPYVLEKFEWRGEYNGKGLVSYSHREMRSSEIPLDQDIIRFMP